MWCLRMWLFVLLMVVLMLNGSVLFMIEVLFFVVNCFMNMFLS